MNDPNLMEKLLEEVNGKLIDHERENVECIPLLICKMSPFVRGMQKSLNFFLKRERLAGNDDKTCWRSNTTKNDFCPDDGDEEIWKNSGSNDRIFFFLPSLNEVIRHGDVCDEKFPKCFY